MPKQPLQLAGVVQAASRGLCVPGSDPWDAYSRAVQEHDPLSRAKLAALQALEQQGVLLA